MSGNSLLLDTNIILYLLEGDTTLNALLYKKKLYVSFISELELLSYSNITAKEREKIRDFLEECIVIDINEHIKEETIRLRRTYKLKLPDSIVIGTGTYLGIPVISADKEFKKIKGSRIIYYEK
jgi:predicted nucleic acid-binding protein